MTQPVIDLTFDECVTLLHTQVVGRVGLSTPIGPRVVPVNYSISSDHIVWRTTPYSELATYAPNGPIAFEVDQLDPHLQQGWSVVVSAVARIVEDPDEVARIRAEEDPSPWAQGLRHLYMRVPIRELSGRRIGLTRGQSLTRDGDLLSAHRP